MEVNDGGFDAFECKKMIRSKMKVMNIRDQFHAFRKKMDLIRSRRRRRHKDKVSLYLPHP